MNLTSLPSGNSNLEAAHAYAFYTKLSPLAYQSSEIPCAALMPRAMSTWEDLKTQGH
jgi:hypothetical protein